MALNDDAVLTAAVGWVYTATVGTAAPTPTEIKNFDPTTFGAGGYAAVQSGGTDGGDSKAGAKLSPLAANGWTNVGHTSRGDLPEFGFDGGDKEVKGTWQNESLREVVTDAIVDYLTLMLHQFDTESFELYYGENASATPGVFAVAGGSPAPVEKALLVVIVDGDRRVAFYSPKASIRRDDSISLAVDEFAALPVRATFLKHAAADKFQWIADGLFA